jgi:hypothetical protein
MTFQFVIIFLDFLVKNRESLYILAYTLSITSYDEVWGVEV